MKTRFTLLLLLVSIFIQAQSKKNKEKITYSVFSGVFLPTGNTKNIRNIGFSTENGIQIPIIKKIKLNTALFYNSSQLFEKNKFNDYGISVSPSYQLASGKIGVSLFSGLGFGKIVADNYSGNYEETDVEIEKFETNKSTSWRLNTGILISYKMSKNWIINSKIQYDKNLNNPLIHSVRDISSAIKGDRIDYDLVSTIPFTKNEIYFSSIGIQLGITYQFQGRKAREVSQRNTEAGTDGVSQPVSAASKSARTVENVRTSGTNDNETEQNGTPIPLQAQDWNSSRSNKTSKTSQVIFPSSNPNGNSQTNIRAAGTNDNETEQNGTPIPTQAQDWNSSRSNKTSKTSRVIFPNSNPNGNSETNARTSGTNDNETEQNGTPIPTQAQDWNSSRSNKTSKTQSVIFPSSNPNGNSQTNIRTSGTNEDETSRTSRVVNPNRNHVKDTIVKKERINLIKMKKSN